MDRQSSYCFVELVIPLPWSRPFNGRLAAWDFT